MLRLFTADNLKLKYGKLRTYPVDLHFPMAQNVEFGFGAREGILGKEDTEKNKNNSNR